MVRKLFGFAMRVAFVVVSSYEKNGQLARVPSAVVFNLGEVPKSTYAGKAPSTRMGTAALIRNALTAAANDRRKRLAAMLADHLRQN